MLSSASHNQRFFSLTSEPVDDDRRSTHIWPYLKPNSSGKNGEKMCTQLTPVLFPAAAVPLVSLEDARVKGTDAAGVVLARLADCGDPPLKLIHVLWGTCIEHTIRL